MGKLSEEEEKFAYNYLSDREAYHHHKEQMAYIGFLVQRIIHICIEKVISPDYSCRAFANARSWFGDGIDRVFPSLHSFAFDRNSFENYATHRRYPHI